MVQSSTEPCVVVIAGGLSGLNISGVAPATVMKNSVLSQPQIGSCVVDDLLGKIQSALSRRLRVRKPLEALRSRRARSRGHFRVRAVASVDSGFVRVASGRCGSISPIGPVLDIEGQESGVFNGFGRARDDKFRASRVRNENIGHLQDLALPRAVLRSDGNAIEADHLQRLRLPIVLELEIQLRIGACVDDPPELFFAAA